MCDSVVELEKISLRVFDPVVEKKKKKKKIEISQKPPKRLSISRAVEYLPPLLLFFQVLFFFVLA